MSSGLQHMALLLPLVCAQAVALASETPLEAKSSVPGGVCRASVWSSTRELDTTAGVGQADCSVSWNPTLAKGLRLALNARAASALGSHNDRRNRAYVREASLMTDTEDWSLRLGRQIISWGRADRIGPSDYFSARDLTSLVADDEEQRLGTDALLVKRHLGQDMSISLVTAKPSANRLPIPNGVGPLTALERPTRPEVALKLDRNAELLDWSVSLHRGYDRSPYYQFQLAGAGGPALYRSFASTQAIGADLATSAGAWVMRAEAAYIKSEFDCQYCTISARNTGKVVLGIERELGANNHLAVQVYGLNRSGYRPPSSRPLPLQASYQGIDKLNSEFGNQEYGLTWRWTTKALNEALRFEFAGVFHAPRHQASSVALRPRLRYALSDRLHLGAGLDRFIGVEQSYFGARRANNLVFLELGYAF
jgi:hypothetical protein